MGAVMLSRLADSLYWMSRYVERAENVARFIDVNTWLSLDLPGGYQEQWGPLINTTGDDALFSSHYKQPSKHNVVHFLTFDTRNPNSILSSLAAARENARVARQYITLEMWEQINRFYFAIHNGAQSAQRGFNPGQDFFSDVVTASHLFLGTLYATMSHNEGWHFCRLGRLIERADKTSRILDTKYYLLLPSVDTVGTPYDDIMWAAVLRSTSAFEMYRKRYQQISPDRIVDFWFSIESFPRHSLLRHICAAFAAHHYRHARRHIFEFRGAATGTGVRGFELHSSPGSYQTGLARIPGQHSGASQPGWRCYPQFSFCFAACARCASACGGRDA
jgi:uncharacterized alpha-E superfamily protein